ncbi:glycosyltransferase family 2 protein [Thiofilum flexile]|uniref:glycosyltransferase family 2 protein n=1 Tax=Thiofilum flexile TaxID=125627 RepID=UPI0003793CD4|nr:glycosyltransferase family 2 protein [Thiofilum flexile]
MTSPVPVVQVLLSTWNGERWLPDLLASLARQTFHNWQLLVRDDGSQDQTLKILLEWQKKHPKQVTDIISANSIGSTASFDQLVRKSSAPYLMFCDQDDVWFPEKIELQVEALYQLEQKYGRSAPLLVHSDLAVIDENKQIISPSFWGYRGFDIKQRKQAYLLTNVVTGCATIFNRHAAQLAFPLPPEAVHHDRWLALVCAWLGHIGALPHPTILYRQHAHNLVGAKRSVAAGDVHKRIDLWSQQANAFLRCFSARLNKADYQQLQALADLQYMKGWERRRHIVQHRLFKQGVVENLALLLFS